VSRCALDSLGIFGFPQNVNLQINLLYRSTIQHRYQSIFFAFLLSIAWTFYVLLCIGHVIFCGMTSSITTRWLLIGLAIPCFLVPLVTALILVGIGIHLSFLDGITISSWVRVRPLSAYRLLTILQVFCVLSGLFPIRYQMGRLCRVTELLDKVKARSSKRGNHPLRRDFIRSPDRAKGDRGRVELSGMGEEVCFNFLDDFSTQNSTTELVFQAHPAVRVPEKAHLNCK
jgi:hypothetical protein